MSEHMFAYWSPGLNRVVEDSVLGVAGAVAAGMTAFGYAPAQNQSALEKAGAETFSHMDELLRLLLA